MFLFILMIFLLFLGFSLSILFGVLRSSLKTFLLLVILLVMLLKDLSLRALDSSVDLLLEVLGLGRLSLIMLLASITSFLVLSVLVLRFSIFVWQTFALVELSSLMVGLSLF